MDDTRVYIAVPAYGAMPAQVALNLALLFHETASAVSATIGMTNLCYLHMSRNSLVEGALQADATHIFWLDSDVICPPGAVKHLLRHDVDVASGLYHYKDGNGRRHAPVAWQGDDMGGVNIDLREPQWVDGVGLGCVLMKTDWLKKMDAPWFELTADKGEDVCFFERLRRDYGVRVLLDPDVRCGHVGDFIVTTEHWQALQEA